MVSVGDVYCVAVGSKRALCRVVKAVSPLGPWDNQGRWLVITCAWVGSPTQLAAALKRPATFAPLVLERLKGRKHVQSIGGPPPPEIRRVGSHLASAAELRIRAPKQPGAWQWVEVQLEAELAYRADPAEYVANQQAIARDQARATASERRAARARTPARPRTLAPRDLRALAKLGATTFAGWRSHPRAFVTEIRAAIKALGLALRDATRVAKVAAALTRTTRRLDRIDAAWDGLIMTPDAEDLVELLVRMAVAAGLDEAYAAHTVDSVRDF